MKKSILKVLSVVLVSALMTFGSNINEVKAYVKPEYHRGERCTYPYVGVECVTWVSTGQKCSVYYNCDQT